jgi:hypothetical protein
MTIGSAEDMETIPRPRIIKKEITESLLVIIIEPPNVICCDFPLQD